MRHLFVFAALLAACHGSDPAKGGGSAASAPQTTPSTVPAGSGSAVADAAAPADAAPVAETKPTAPVTELAPATGHDFTPEGKALLVVGACGAGDVPAGFDAAKGKEPFGGLLGPHCEAIKAAQQDYLTKWVKPARAFFAEHVPANVPKRVVYPFAGGDLSTALTVYPDADEITTLSLEPAGDPRDLAVLKGRDLEKALKKVEYELSFLYRVNFSNTINMIEAMREGSLPTQFIFGLSALTIHGYEVDAVHYFRLEPDGAIHYLDDADLAKAPDPLKGKPMVRNRIFANVEIRFHKAGGRVQVYRHIQQNLDDEHLKQDNRVIKHLEAKGAIAGMTKAASYLLSWDSFSTMRNYLTGHVVWMVSDATGVAPKWGKPAGFEYETYGGFVLPHIPAGNGIAKDWRAEFESEPHRDLGFRFGYYDKHSTNHLIIMRKKATP